MNPLDPGSVLSGRYSTTSTPLARQAWTSEEGDVGTSFDERAPDVVSVQPGQKRIFKVLKLSFFAFNIVVLCCLCSGL